MIIVDQIGARERRYSDLGVKLRQVETGNLYEDAVDIVPCPYTYVETDEPIPPDETDATEADYQAALSELGVNV